MSEMKAHVETRDCQHRAECYQSGGSLCLINPQPIPDDIKGEELEDANAGWYGCCPAEYEYQIDDTEPVDPRDGACPRLLAHATKRIAELKALAVPEGADVNVRWPSNDGKLIFIAIKDRDEPDFGWAAYRNTPRFTTKKRGRCGSLEEAIAAAEEATQ